MDVIWFSVLAFLALGVGTLIGFLWGKNRLMQYKTLAEKERQSLLTMCEQLKGEKEIQRQSFDVERRAFRDTQQLMKDNFEQTKKDLMEQQRMAELRWKEQTDVVKQQFTALAGEVLENKQSHLQQYNKDQMDALLKPLKERLDNLGKAVTDTNAASAAGKASLEEIIRSLMEKADKIGSDAVNLTKALKGNTKSQGDWGEMILERMLEESGLKKGEEYYPQEDHLTEDGHHVRPDMIVRFPEKRCVIIDSKVSLTAYAEYVSADEEMTRQSALKAHLKSVKDHIDELAAKDYSKVVRESIGYVLMFVPNEASYIAAVQADSSLISYAYRKRIILISPTNLIMALQLAHNLWQSERQSRNVEEIIRRGSALYDKFVGFTENFCKIGDSLQKAQACYDASYKQLVSGSGNLTRQMEQLRNMGLTPTKSLSSRIKDSSEGEE